MDIKNKRVWITGASSGIGEALVYAFAQRGAQLIISARNTSELERVKAACVAGTNVEIVPLDLGNHSDIFEKAKQVLQNGAVDILVNNAGISQRSLTKDTAFEVDMNLINVNLLGTIALTKAILPQMLAQKESQIITITSVMGKLGAPLRSSYAAAKHGLHGFFDTLRAECHDDGLRVLLVVPGYVRTNISKNALTADGKKQGTMDAATDKGFAPEVVAERIISAMQAEKAELSVVAGRERLALLLKRFVPSILRNIVRKAATT